MKYATQIPKSEKEFNPQKSYDSFRNNFYINWEMFFPIKLESKNHIKVISSPYLKRVEFGRRFKNRSFENFLAHCQVFQKGL